MLVSLAILFGTISICISTLMVYSAIVVASRTQNDMQQLRVHQDGFSYATRLANREQVASLAAAS